MIISICIPTYNRLTVLKEAIESCLNQTLLPDEILIGDDSLMDDTEQWVTNTLNGQGIKIRYFHNRPALRQSRNVNWLFQEAAGDLTILLHDDDLLLPNALEDLHSCFVKYPEIDAAFGKQYLISNDGIKDAANSELLNKAFYRTLAYEGIKLTSLESGFLQQFPNDGYMIRSHITRTIQYIYEAGDCCDFNFGVKVGLGNYKIFFINTYTACYRISPDAFGLNSNSAMCAFDIVSNLDVPSDSLHYKNHWLDSKAPTAVMNAAKLKHYRKAFQIYFSRYHRGSILSLGGIKRLMVISYHFLKNRMGFFSEN